MVFACGCGGSEQQSFSDSRGSAQPSATANAATPTPQATLTPVVRAGQSIQAAIEAAAPNTTITVEPGIYHESAVGGNALLITKDGLQLIGLSTAGNPVILENTGGQTNGIWVSPAGPEDALGAYDEEHPRCGTNGEEVHGFTLTGFTVRGFDELGVYLACTDGFTLSNNLSHDNQFYDLFPVRSHNGVISNNEAFNTPLDAAIYVGQSDHVTVSGNHSHDSLIGIEVESSIDVTVSDNETNNNTAGMLADAVPDLQQSDQSNVSFLRNNVHDNNHTNTGRPPDFTSTISPGTGIQDSSGSNITVQGNTITNNNFGGIVIFSYFLPFPIGVRIVDNTLTGNGLSPPPTPAFVAAAADITWQDGEGTGICASGNTPTATVKISSLSQALPVCQ
jgi:parallel beta-helix repeat protein